MSCLVHRITIALNTLRRVRINETRERERDREKDQGREKETEKDQQQNRREREMGGKDRNHTVILGWFSAAGDCVPHQWSLGSDVGWSWRVVAVHCVVSGGGLGE